VAGVSDEPEHEEPGTASKAPDPLIGVTVGRYRIESLLEIGGMGRVYRALGPEGELVALKLVRGDLAEDSIFRKRFEREAMIAQQVKNRHVVPVLDTGEHEGVPYLSQRFIEGGSLEQKLKREGRLDVPTTLKLCAEVADGLDALFAGGMVHRDVKPANVLLELDGTALITDFGLAKDSEGTNLTRPGQALGSLDYMSPEQIRGEAVSAATDVYALGCVICQCLSGTPPFADRKGMRILWAQLQDEPPDPCAELPGAPPGLGAAVLRALAKSAAERPQSAGEYARLLHEAAGIEPPSAA
jgi:serine/threonine protein kinase